MGAPRKPKSTIIRYVGIQTAMRTIARVIKFVPLGRIGKANTETTKLMGRKIIEMMVRVRDVLALGDCNPCFENGGGVEELKM